ncbi:MAG: TPM domain-containing protein [Nitrospirae bacterium]|nr:TPM domain-containing protein [Nitrospirota bacterium]MDE3041472.1 TPM domain-containing protein [Nitrospirota bacterium]
MKPFTDIERERIKQAVQQAERVTKGEIVPMIVPASALYREAGYRTGLMLALLALALLLTIEIYWLPWGWHAGNAGWLLLAVVASYGLGQWLGRIPVVIRFVTSRERMAHKVTLRAEQAFYKHGLHNTKGRTGILIFVSLLERRVHVLADKGINDRVPDGTWDGLVNGIIEGIRTGRATDAICTAIAKCGALLAQVSPAGSGDNPNELPDMLIQEP